VDCWPCCCNASAREGLSWSSGAHAAPPGYSVEALEEPFRGTLEIFKQRNGKATEEISMQYLILLTVVSVMVLYVLIIAGCLCYVARHGHRTS